MVGCLSGLSFFPLPRAPGCCEQPLTSSWALCGRKDTGQAHPVRLPTAANPAGPLGVGQLFWGLLESLELFLCIVHRASLAGQLHLPWLGTRLNKEQKPSWTSRAPFFVPLPHISCVSKEVSRVVLPTHLLSQGLPGPTLEASTLMARGGCGAQGQ